MNGFFGHLRTVMRHRRLVRKFCFKCGLYRQGLAHDLSKYFPTEFLAGAKYFTGKCSPNDLERRHKCYSAAWMHHKGRNRHHWEYWTDYSMDERAYVAMPMPRRYLAEMLCDRIAASKIYNGSNYTDEAPLDYLMHGKVRDAMNPQTLELLTRFLTQLRDEGEDAMFKSLRAWAREKE